MTENVTFSFGENWRDYLRTAAESEIEAATDDIRRWLSEEDIRGKSIVGTATHCGA